MISAQEARGLLRAGKISHAEAKKLCQPYIDVVNEGAKRISKEYGGKVKKVHMASFHR